MLRHIFLVALFSTLAIPLIGKDKDKDKSKLPKFIVDGRYVYVTNEVGYNTVSQTTAEDYGAERAVREQIGRWGRYQVVYSPDQADFIIGVRVARKAVTPGIRIGKRPNGQPDWAPAIRTDVGPSNDMLSVYSPNSGTDSAPFWRKTQKYGLSTPVPLLQAFRKDVEEAAKKASTTPPPPQP